MHMLFRAQDGKKDVLRQMDHGERGHEQGLRLGTGAGLDLGTGVTGVGTKE